MEKLFNIKMRAGRWDSNRDEYEHISGAERISNRNSLEGITKNLVNRALNHDKGQVDSINISIDIIDIKKISYIPCVDVTNIECKKPDEAQEHIVKLLKEINIEKDKTQKILDILKCDYSMRGAALLDVVSMKRLEIDKKRGIRATGMDWKANMKSELEEKLKTHSMNNDHVKEALVLASKIIYKKGVLGEVCISDDPNYTTGYVTIRDRGYFRINNLKPLGSKIGGRVILFDLRYGNSDDYIDFLENSISIVDTLPNIK